MTPEQNPPDKPAAMFRCEVRRLLLINDEVRVRLRFKDSTHHYLVRYEDGKGLRLVPVGPANGVQVDAVSVGEFSVLTESNAETTWYCNALSTWATKGDMLLWSTDVPMEGQPKSMKILGDVLFVTTKAGHSFYIRKDTGEVAFYDKTVLPGNDPMKEVLENGRDNMAIDGRRRSLARFITAAVVLNDRRAIPFLIDCIDKGDGLQVKAMAVGALEKFNGNPDLWAPKNPKPGQMHLHWVGTKRVYPNENRQAEIARWRKVFAAELDN